MVVLIGVSVNCGRIDSNELVVMPVPVAREDGNSRDRPPRTIDGVHPEHGDLDQAVKVSGLAVAACGRCVRGARSPIVNQRTNAIIRDYEQRQRRWRRQRSNTKQSAIELQNTECYTRTNTHDRS